MKKKTRCNQFLVSSKISTDVPWHVISVVLPKDSMATPPFDTHTKHFWRIYKIRKLKIGFMIVLLYQTFSNMSRQKP